MINTGNMQGMTPRGGGMAPQQMPNNMQQKQAIQREVARILQQFSVPPGWQSTLALPHRMNNILQLVTSIRLVKTPADQALHIATAFERETITKSVDRATYDATIRDKLNEFHAQREKQAASMELQFQNPQNGQMNMGMQQVPMQNGVPHSRPGQFQQGFPNSQLQRAMQPTPMPTQQQFMQNCNQQQQHLMNNSLSNPQMQMQPAQQGQNPSQNIHRSMTGNPVPLTAQESAQVISMAHQMRSKASPQDIESLKQRLASAPDDTKRMWQQANADPLAMYFRNMAVKSFQQHKARLASQHQIQPNTMPGMGATPQQPNSMAQNTASTAAPQFGGVTQGFDPSFGGNMQQFGSQIFGLQQDALRSQEEGQVVVPVSGNQTASQQPTMQSTTMNQPTPARSMMNSQMTQQEKMQQAARLQAQRIQNAGGMQHHMQAHQNNLQGQAGGLNGHPSQAPPQNSPAMPNLNRPLGPPTQLSQNQGPSQLRQPGPPPQVQAKDAGSANQRSQQQPQGQSSGGDAGQHQLPPHVQQKLSNMPPAQQQAFFLQYQRTAGARNQAANLGLRTQANGAGMSGQDFRIGQAQPPQGHQINQPTPGQTPAPGGQNFGSFDPTISQPQNMSVPGQQIVQGRPFEGQFRPQQPQQMPQSRVMPGPLPKMNEDQLRMMDQRPFPPNFLNANNMPPPEIKLWGELKAWAARNQNSMPSDIMGKLKQVQAFQFGELVKRHTFANQQRSSQMPVAPTSMSSAPVQQSGPAPPAPMVGTQGNMAQAPNTNNFPIGMPQNMPIITPSSAEDLRNIRMQNPRFQNVPDEVLGQHIMKQKIARFQAFAAQQRQNMTSQQIQYENMQQRAQLQHQFQKQSFMMNGQNGQGQPQPPATQGQQAASHAVKAATPSMGQGPIQGSPYAQPSRSSVRPPVQNQPSQKGTKRANEDDVVEVPNPKLAQQQQQRKVQPPTKQTPSQQKPSASQAERDTGLQQQQQKQSSQYAVELQNQAAQITLPQLPPPIFALARSMPRNAQESAARHLRYKQILDEVSKNQVPRAEVPMNNQMRNNTIAFLMRAREEQAKVKVAIQSWFVTTNEEERIREYLHSELAFARQYRGDQFPDRFTMSLPEMQEIHKKTMTCAKMMMLFHKFKGQVLAKLRQPMPVENSVGSASVKSGTAKAAPEAPTRQAPALQRNHSNRENRAPAAPTSDKPPFSFGALSPPSGDGVPILYGPNQLTQDKLSLPPTKRRKIQNQTGSSVSTPAQGHGTPATTNTPPKVAKTSSPRVQRPNVAPAPTFKCPEASCEFASKGFATMDDLNKHAGEKHQVVELPIEDPLEWALEGVRMGLGLGLSMLDVSKDDAAKNKEWAKKEWAKHVEMESERSALACVAMKKSASTQGLTPMRMEGGTPMSRMASQAGYQINLGVPQTPQQNNNSVKTPASDAKQSSSKSGPGESSKVGSTSKEPTTPPNNPWKETSISPSELSSFFPSPLDLQGFSLASLTPASTLSSSKSTTNSPKESDIGEGDMLDIRIESDSWMPQPFSAGLLKERTYEPMPDDVWDDLNDPLMEMSWEDAFGKIIEPDRNSKEWKSMTAEEQERITPFDAGRFRWENF